MIKLVGELEVTNNPTMLENVLKKLVNMRACMMIVDIYMPTRPHDQMTAASRATVINMQF